MKVLDGSLLSSMPVRLSQEKMEEIFQELNLGIPDGVTPLEHGGP